ncbi:MAG: hypothetical protein IKA65_07650 [Lentisphaeria bacterium]|nr:hypothetical protein [Lentisphaeria bacterium]
MSKLNLKNLGNDPIYRSAPFWAWNGKLDPDEIRRQVRIMHEMHMGGFFIHSRAGLETEYLGKEWFECVKSAIDEAEKLDMYANLYDEDRWPSGAAGGLITQDKKFRMRYLEFYDAEKELPFPAEDVLLHKYFILILDENGQVQDYRPAAPGETGGPGEKAVQIVVRIAPSSETYNNGAYLDTTNPEAVQAFIASTHERYLAECGSKFGKSIPCFFTDEPNYLDLATPNRRPWSDRLPGLFAAECGNTLEDFLPELFWHCGKDFSEFRYWFYRTMTWLFNDTFMKICGQWCSQHNIQLTGHLLREDTLSQQIHAIGAAMPGYEYMQAPGIDVLTARWNVLNTAKQLVSTARQLGKKHLLSETYGCTGWDFPLAGHKALGDWQYALGINFRCQHLMWYSMRGKAKRDYPASIGAQSPWYKAHDQLERYFARLGELFIRAESPADLLVIHPIETMWGYAGSYDSSMSFAPEYDRSFDLLARELIGQHLNFDYGDESLMSKYGDISGAHLRVGQAQYQTVLIPRVETLRSSTVKLLKDFADQGGKVYFIGPVPGRIDARKDNARELEELYQKFQPLPAANFARILRRNAADCSITDASCEEASSVILQHGEIKSGITLLFAVNMGCTFENQQDVPDLELRNADLYGLQVKVPAAPGKTVCQLDLFSGTLTNMQFEYKNNCYYFQTDLPALDSRCFVIAEADVLPEICPAVNFVRRESVPLLEKAADLSEDNLLVLDHASAYCQGRLAAEKTYILKLDDQLRTLHGLSPRSNQQLQPWFCPRGSKSFPVTLEYEFFCEAPPVSDVRLIIESPEIFKIKLNGCPIENHSCGFWCDPALEKVTLPAGAFVTGRNILQLDFDYDENFAGLESIFLSGRFGVKNQNTLTALPEIRSGKSSDEQFMPFYAGNVTYNFDFELTQSCACQVDLKKWQGSAISVRWDSGKEQIFYTMPGKQTAEVQLEAGKHQLQITVYGHRRNAFGPFYCAQRPFWVGPYEFTVIERSEKEVVPFGLLAQPELWTSD